MNRRRRSSGVLAPLVLLTAGCTQVASRPEYVEVMHNLHAAHHATPRDRPRRPDGRRPSTRPVPPELAGPQPVDVYIRRALAENRTVQAARPTSWPCTTASRRSPLWTTRSSRTPSIPARTTVCRPPPGFMPWNLLIAQQFPWFGTLALRGEAAEQDVQVALAELAPPSSTWSRRQAGLLRPGLQRAGRADPARQPRLVEDFIEIARTRYETGQTSQQDVLSAEVVLADLDRELVAIRQGIDSARADLAELLHVSPEADLQTMPGRSVGDVPAQIDRLYRWPSPRVPS